MEDEGSGKYTILTFHRKSKLKVNGKLKKLSLWVPSNVNY